MRTSYLFVSALLLATAGAAPAATIGFNGNFNQDDDVQLFYYSVSSLSLVTVSTTSFAGGGFSPIITLFNASGAFQNEDIGFSDTNDASFTYNSLPGELYIVALTQWDNQANASQTFGNLSEGFKRDGQGNFTAEEPFNAPGPGTQFLMETTREQRTSSWSIVFSSDDPTLQAYVPEPSTAVLSLTGALLLGASLARKRKSRLKRPE